MEMGGILKQQRRTGESSVKKKISKKAWSEWKWAWFMIAPTMIGLIVLNIIPIFQTLYLSFFKSGASEKGIFL